MNRNTSLARKTSWSWGKVGHGPLRVISANADWATRCTVRLTWGEKKRLGSSVTPRRFKRSTRLKPERGAGQRKRGRLGAPTANNDLRRFIDTQGLVIGSASSPNMI